MAEVLDRAEIRKRIDELELLDSIYAAISDVQSAEWKPGETVRVIIEAKDGAVAFVHGVPPRALIAALRYIALGAPADHVQEVAA